MPTVIFDPARLHGSASISLEDERMRDGSALIAATEKEACGIHADRDGSRAAVLLCANALGSGVTVRATKGPGEPPLRSAAQILTIFRQMGLLAYEEQNEWYVTSPSRAELMPVALNATDVTGHACLLALVLTQAQGRSTLTGMRQLGEGECGRLIRAQEVLDRLGARVSLSEDLDILTVEGQGRKPLRGGFAADAQGDHWVVLLLSIAALIADAPITVRGAEALEPFWPSYLETYQSLGGKLRQEDENDH